MRLKIYQKLLLSFLILAIVILAMGYLRGYGIFLVSDRNLKRVTDLNYVYSLSEHLRFSIAFDLIMPANDYISTADLAYKSEFEKALIEVNSNFKELYAKKELSEKERKVLQDARKGIDEIIVKKSREIFSLENPIGNPSAMEWRRQIDAETHRISDLIEDNIDDFIKAEIAEVIKRTEKFKTLVNWVFVLTTAISLFLSYLFAIRISNSISMPLKKLRDSTGEISAGNLKARVDIKTGDELEDLGNAFNKMVQNLEQNIVIRKQAEEKLRQTNEFNEAILKGIPFGMDIVDEEGNIMYLNEQLTAIVDKDALGKKCFLLYKDNSQQCDKCPLRNGIKIGKMGTIEVGGVLGGRIFNIAHIGINYQGRKGILEIFEDITERKQIEGSSRLAELGKLVSSMAHEVNNPLMIISGNAQLSLMEEIQSEAVKNNLKIIIDESQKAKGIIQRLLRFSRPSKGETKEVDINKSIEAVVGIVEHQFKLANVEIKRNYLETPPLISIDEQQMQEVFMNLINNAVEAMPDGGVITISTSLERDFLRLDFKDTGSGMSEEVKKKALEPFFTTKEKGTGLGLSVCYGIIKAHNGEIKFESELNKGTTVTVLLPLVGGGKA